MGVLSSREQQIDLDLAALDVLHELVRALLDELPSQQVGRERADHLDVADGGVGVQGGPRCRRLGRERGKEQTRHVAADDPVLPPT